VKYSHERLSEFPDIDVENSPRLLIETVGAAGLRYRWKASGKTSTTWVESKALPVEDVKDTAGSGDWCTAGLLSKVAARGYAHFSAATDECMAEAIKFGQALAAWNCRFEGARGGMYAVSRQEFHAQVDEILSGSNALIPVKKGASQATPSRSIVCRVCEHSASRTAKRRKAK
jgi:hypothetical protein